MRILRTGEYQPVHVYMADEFYEPMQKLKALSELIGMFGESEQIHNHLGLAYLLESIISDFEEKIEIVDRS